MKELNIIQTKLVANKDKHNQFGGFDYRSLETIMNSVKPLLAETKCTLTFTDELMLIGERYYIKSTATLKNSNGETETATAWAREQDQKKGYDEAQITGSSSSYSRKYAACSLLGISDGFDPDAMDNREEGQKSSTKASKPQVEATDQPTIETALEAVKNAKNEAELKKVWAKFKPQFGKNAEFVKAVQESPVNPKGGRSNG